jgi:hypothetical protein
MGFVMDKVALGQVFSEYFGFPRQFSFHRLHHIHHHLSSGADIIGQLMADVPSRLSLTPLQETKKNMNCFRLLRGSPTAQLEVDGDQLSRSVKMKTTFI